MLTIRKEQVDSLKSIPTTRFQEEMIEHIKEYFPKQYEILGKDKTVNAIQYTLERAKSYKFTTKRNACLYIGLAFMLGSNFDLDPQYPWATNILSDISIYHPVKIIDQLDQAALTFLDQTAGINDENFQLSLLRFKNVLAMEYTESSSGRIGTDILNLFETNYPQKYAIVGAENLKLLIVQGIQSANYYKLHGNRGTTLYIILSYLFGAGCDTDPLFPWISQILNDDKYQIPEQKTDQLNIKAIIYINKLLA